MTISNQVPGIFIHLCCIHYRLIIQKNMTHDTYTHICKYDETEQPFDVDCHFGCGIIWLVDSWHSIYSIIIISNNSDDKSNIDSVKIVCNITEIPINIP